MILTVYKSKQLVSCIQSTQFGLIFTEQLPQTVLRQVLQESIVLLRHFEVAHVFRFFLESFGGDLIFALFRCHSVVQKQPMCLTTHRETDRKFNELLKNI